MQKKTFLLSVSWILVLSIWWAEIADKYAVTRSTASSTEAAAAFYAKSELYSGFEFQPFLGVQGFFFFPILY